MTRKGVRKKEGEGLGVGSWVDTDHVISGCAHSAAVGNVQETICVNSSFHIDEAFRSRKTLIAIDNPLVTSPVPCILQKGPPSQLGS